MSSPDAWCVICDAWYVIRDGFYWHVSLVTYWRSPRFDGGDKLRGVALLGEGAMEHSHPDCERRQQHYPGGSAGDAGKRLLRDRRQLDVQPIQQGIASGEERAEVRDQQRADDRAGADEDQDRTTESE